MELLAALRAQAPGLVVAVPLLGAVLALLAPGPRAAITIGSLAVLVASLIGVDLAIQALFVAPVGVYPVGGWPAPMGISFRVDAVGALGLGSLAAAFLLSWPAAVAGLGEVSEGERRAGAVAAALVLMTALTLICLAGDAITLTLAMALASICTTSLATLDAGRDRRALAAAFRALILLGAATVMMFLGAAFQFAAVGAFDIASVAALANAAPGPLLTPAGMALTVAGLLCAAGLAPMNAWLGGLLGRGAAFAAPWIGVFVTFAGSLALVRAVAMAQAGQTPGLDAALALALAVVGAFSLALGSLQAAGAQSPRRLAAGVITAQAGLTVMAASLVSPAGYAAGLMHALTQSVAAIGFLAALPAHSTTGAPMRALDGLGRQAPLRAGAMAVCLLALLGAPLTAGFLSKWLIIAAAVEKDLWWIAAAAALAALAGVIFAGRVLVRLYMRKPTADTPAPEAGGRWALGLAIICAGLAVTFGLDAGWPLRAAQIAGSALAHLVAHPVEVGP